MKKIKINYCINCEEDVKFPKGKCENCKEKYDNVVPSSFRDDYKYDFGN